MSTRNSDNSELKHKEMTANPGYALGQLAKAFATTQSHEDPDTRVRASAKIENWVKIFEGMLSGALQVGSRTPVSGTPAWATLEVVQGGFTTGELLAAGAIQAHEQELLAIVSADPSISTRVALNSYYLSEPGQIELHGMLSTGCYRINVPEEGALLVVAWLLEHGDPDKARSVLDEISPFLTRLRFYPVSDTRPLPAGSLVYLQTVRRTIQNLEKLKISTRIQAQREAVLIWAPTSDRVVELFLETVEGGAPSLEQGPNGKLVRTTTGKLIINGGWPCQKYPADWNIRALDLLKEIRRLRSEHHLCGKPERRKKSTFAALRHYLEICAADPRRLNGKDVGMIRLLLAGIAVKRGDPDSVRCRELRYEQTRLAHLPTNAELAKVAIARLTPLAPDEGVNFLDQVLMPVTDIEAREHKLPSGQVIADRLGEKVRRCFTAPINDLIELGIITSGEVLAKVIPQITAQVRAAGLADPDLRRLYGAIYRAFRRRRSLLLLNLESQVKLEELPWVREINRYRKDGLDTKEQSRQTLEQVVVQAITAFPQQILPNKLLQEIRSLAEGAGLHLPIVDEVAADIFMGEFSEKFLHAAQKAGELLEGTLYERYYGIPYVQIRKISDVQPSRFGTPTSPSFTRFCTDLACASASDNRWSVARNGKIIEQEQILTTHNLAVLFDALGLARALQPELENLSRRCFAWICRRLQQKIDTWKARLQTVKNTAYAWRQMIFYLSQTSKDRIEMFQHWADAYLGKQTPIFQARFKPALQGLAMAAQGFSLPPEQQACEEAGGGARRFLGWTTEKHWLLS
jgi:hypothetical protein